MCGQDDERKSENDYNTGILHYLKSFCSSSTWMYSPVFVCVRTHLSMHEEDRAHVCARARVEITT